MSKLMWIQGSPMEDLSYSNGVGAAFIKAYGAKHPADTVEVVNVFKMSLPAFDGPAARAKYAIMHGQKHSAEQAAIWKGIEGVIAQFKAADKYLITSPMWNFGIPYRLKQYFDVIVQPGYTFSFSPKDGYQGLVGNKPAVAIFARGGEYGDNADYDFQKRYVHLVLGFMGITNVRSLVVEPTLMNGPDVAKARKLACSTEVEKLAATF